jgi:hypothetical protein
MLLMTMLILIFALGVLDTTRGTGISLCRKSLQLIFIQSLICIMGVHEKNTGYNGKSVCT